MGAIVNSTFVTLDGVINHMDQWHFDYLSEQSDVFALAQLQDAGAMLMGRATYDVYAQVWPGRDGDYADLINAVPKHVASTTLTDPQWHGTEVVAGDLPAAAARLRDEVDGTVLMHGFGPVAKSLVAAGLLDELHLWYHPVLAGVGGPEDVLFTPGLHASFETSDVTTFDNGIVVVSMRTRR